MSGNTKTKKCMNGQCRKKAKLVKETSRCMYYVCKCGTSWSEPKEKKKK